jgi:hypothetical protein
MHPLSTSRLLIGVLLSVAACDIAGPEAFRGELNGHGYLAHAGGGGGYYAEVRIYPGIRRGSVIFFNRSGMSDERFLDQVDHHFVRQAGP